MTWYGLVMGGEYLMFAIGLTLIFGVMRIVNMAHGELYMLGAMLIYTLMTFAGMNYFLAGGLAVVILAAVGIAFNRVAILPLLRPAPLSIFLTTMALSYVIVNASVAIWGAYPHHLTVSFPMRIEVGGIYMAGSEIALLIVVVIAIVGLNLLLSKSGLGRSMRATSQNMVGAQLVGINVARVFDYTMVLAAMLAAAGGIMSASIMSAYPTMGAEMLLMAFAVVILGGMGNIKGNILIAFILGLIQGLFSYFAISYWRLVLAYGFMIVVLLFKPEGLFARRT